MVGNLIYTLQGSRNCFVTCRQEQLRESSFKGISLWLSKLYRRHYIGLIEAPTWHIATTKLQLHKCITLKAIKNWRWRSPGSKARSYAALVFSANINTTTGTFFTSVQAVGMRAPIFDSFPQLSSFWLLIACQSWWEGLGKVLMRVLVWQWSSRNYVKTSTVSEVVVNIHYPLQTQ